MSTNGDRRNLLSIGDVAHATGISTATIRVWERRYGRPVPIRLPSGHRRYTVDQMHWLRRVAEALAQGGRPSKIVKADDAELDALLQDKEPEAPEPEVISEPDLERYLDLIIRYRENDLLDLLWAEWNEHGPATFLTRRLAPLLERVGSMWARGDLDVRHEHFLSEVVVYFLRAARLGLEVNPKGPVVVLATLEGESHRLGLYMAAVICTLGGGRPHILGGETPCAEIASAARELNAAAIGLSVSLATGGVQTDRCLVHLREMLPDEVRIVVGGRGSRGARRGPRGVEYRETLEGFLDWMREVAA